MNNRFLAFGTLLVISGSLSTLMTKWCVRSTACGDYGCKNGPRNFIHPYVLCLFKFVGEFICFPIHIILRCVTQRRSMSSGEQPQNCLPCTRWLVFLAPTVCSLVAIVTVHIGLNLTFSATNQMLRGASLLFNGLLSVAFLAQTVMPFQWLGLSLITIGLAMVGSADIIFNEKQDLIQPNLNAVIAGGLLILLAEIVAATQAVLEQRFIRKYNVSPLLAVGLEGLFGTLIVGPLLVPMYYIHANLPLTRDPNGRLENIFDALQMMSNNSQIIASIILMTISGTIFNYAGMVLIKEQSSLTKAVLDSCQVVPTWIVSVLVQWTSANLQPIMMQISGSFLILLVGPSVYFDRIFAPMLRYCGLLKERSTWEMRGDDFNHRSTRSGDNTWDNHMSESVQRQISSTRDTDPLVSSN